MDALPKNAAGKVLRVHFSSRASLPSIDEDSSVMLRLFEGQCPLQGAALSSPVAVSPVELNMTVVEAFLSQQPGVTRAVVLLLDLPARRDAVVALVSPASVDTNSLLRECVCSMHSYLCPLFIHGTDMLDGLVLTAGENGMGETLEALVAQAVEKFAALSVVLPRTDIERDLETIWRDQLMFERAVSVTSSFFELGGDSLRAGALVNAIRKEFGVGLTVADLFTSPTIEGMAHKISFLRKLESNHAPDEMEKQYEGAGVNVGVAETSVSREGEDSFIFDESSNWEYSMKYSSTSPMCLLVQLLPFVLVFPVRRLTMWFLIAAPWVQLMNLGVDRFPALILAMITMRCVSQCLFPLVGVACKWLIIGRFKAGRYPIWGTMYLKWWLVEQIIKIMGQGVYTDDFPLIGPYLVQFYFSLMVCSLDGKACDM